MTLFCEVLPCVLMARIGVRELRQNASEWIRRAHAGERIEVTRRGEVMAVLGPPSREGALAQLREAGRLKPASVGPPLPPPVRTRRPASEALAELRADER
jgi:prevent-host-death family protein